MKKTSKCYYTKSENKTNTILSCCTLKRHQLLVWEIEDAYCDLIMQILASRKFEFVFHGLTCIS